MIDTNEISIQKNILKKGPVIYHPEDYLIDSDKIKKNRTLEELNQIYKLYLQENNLNYDDITIIGQFSIIFNNSKFALWHTMTRQEQNEVLDEAVMLPQLYDEMINSISITAGDAVIIKGIVKDAYQNAIDSFSHAAFLQKKYTHKFPGIKIILYADQQKEELVLAVIDNGHGEIFSKPKKSFLGAQNDDDFISRFVDWVIRRYIEKEDVRHDIAYTGGQGMALKKIKFELQLNVNLHFLKSGAVFETRLKNYF